MPEPVKPNPSPDLFKQLGEFAGYIMPRTAEGLIYNKEQIPYSTFIEMEDDAQIKAVLTVIKAPLTNVKWKIKCESNEIRKFITDDLEPMWGDLVYTLLNAINFGFQVFEAVFERGKWISYAKILDIHPETVYLKIDEQGNFDGFQQQTTKGKVTIPKEKARIFCVDKRFGNWYGRSRLRSAYFYWFLDKYTYDFENIYLERYAQPLMVGKAPPGKSPTSTAKAEDNIDLMLNLLKALQNSSVVALSSEMDPKTKEAKWDIEMLEALRRGADFIARHRHLDIMKSRGIFAPDLVFSAPVGGASYALAKEHADVFIGAEEAILKGIKSFMDHQHIPPLVKYNFGLKAPRVTWEYETISSSTKRTLSDLVRVLVASGQTELDQEWLEAAVGMKFKPAIGKPEEGSYV